MEYVEPNSYEDKQMFLGEVRVETYYYLIWILLCRSNQHPPSQALTLT